MEIPVLLCYTIDRAICILKENGISNTVITRTGACFVQGTVSGLKGLYAKG